MPNLDVYDEMSKVNEVRKYKCRYCGKILSRPRIDEVIRSGIHIDNLHRTWECINCKIYQVVE